MLLARIKGEETRWTKDGISVVEIQSAEIEVMKQRQSFKNESDTMHMKRDGAGPKRQQVNRTSAICHLDLVMSEDGVLRVGGRLRNAGRSDEAMHPIILP